MDQDYDLRRLSIRLSVIIIDEAALWYVASFGVLTVLTHLAQLSSIRFVDYSYLALGLLIIISLGAARTLWRNVLKAQTKDWLSFALVIAAGGLAGFLVVNLQPIRPFGGVNDDYYYFANAVYYYFNSGQPFNFVVHSLYSGGAPFVSASYLTTGAFQYIQASIAYMLHADFVKFAYLVVAPISALMFPFSLYLLLTRFTDDTLGAAFGSFAALLVVMWLGEGDTAPGFWIFTRVFQGKCIVVSTGLCLFAYYSLNYFEHQGWSEWLRLVLLAIALVGMSSTAIMILPVAAAILFLSYLFAFSQKPLQSIPAIAKLGAVYVASLFYLFLAAAYIASVDSAAAAAYINRQYPSVFGGYALSFVNPQAPTTPIVLIVFCIASIFLAVKNVRRYVLAQILLPFLILNPWISNLLIKLFQGVYFRIFYILPLFFSIGLTLALLFDRTKSLRRSIRAALWTVVLLGIISMAFVLPTSILKSIHSFASNYSGQRYEVAMKVIETISPRIVLAPDPISETIFTFNPDFPQMIIEKDNTNYFLWAQNRQQEGQMRMDTQAFLLGDSGESNENYQSFLKLIQRYPEIGTIVFKEVVLSKYPALENFLSTLGFSNSVNQDGYFIAWK
jgi:hypothetical protein